MFDKLIESNPKARAGGKFGGSTSVSVALHVLLAYAAVQATLSAGQKFAEKQLDTTMVFIQPEEKKEEQKQPEVKLEEPKGFTALLAPVNIPTNIPPINLNEKFDPRDFSGVGNVIVEVIIDTTGHAEPNSLRIVQSTNKAFELAARDAVLKSLYRPGRVRGQAVRVLVQVPIAFSIRH